MKQMFFLLAFLREGFAGTIKKHTCVHRCTIITKMYIIGNIELPCHSIIHGK